MDEEYVQEGSGGPATPDQPPPTGDPRVDDALAGLSRLPGTPADEHVAVLEEAYGRLRDILGELDAEPDPDQGRR
jgi:hypothetical protein